MPAPTSPTPRGFIKAEIAVAVKVKVGDTSEDIRRLLREAAKDAINRNTYNISLEYMESPNA